MKMDGGNPRTGQQGTGRSLREAREDMGLSLPEVEQRTRIRARYLGALEREEFDVLPAVYVLGSLKTYADFLGLDGAALSQQLRADLVEPEESETPAQPAAGRDEDDGHGAGPAWAVGFDHLFVGMGVILISILAIMTLVAAIAQGDESPVSQLDEPSTPEAPSEIALAGNVGDRTVPQPLPADGAPFDAPNAKDAKGGEKDAKNGEKDGPEAPKKDENGEEQDKEGEQAPIFGDVEFVPMSPSYPPAASAASAPAPASASASASVAPAPAPASVSALASAAPSSASPGPSAPAAGSTERPPASPEFGGTPTPPPGGATAAPSAASVAPDHRPAPAPAGPGGGVGPSGPVAADAGRISAEVDRSIDEVFGEVGLD